MKLLMSPASPFARKVRVMLRETGTTAVTEVAVTTTPLASAPEILAANPLGKIPALIRNDGPALYDSRVITRFLDAHLKAGLYPQQRLYEVLTLEATADAICDAAVAMTYERRFRSEAQQMPEWLDAQWSKISRALDVLGDRWLSHLNGPIDMGQIALGCALSYLDLRHDARGWRIGRADLASWHATFCNRASMIATVPD